MTIQKTNTEHNTRYYAAIKHNNRYMFRGQPKPDYFEVKTAMGAGDQGVVYFFFGATDSDLATIEKIQDDSSGYWSYSTASQFNSAIGAAGLKDKVRCYHFWFNREYKLCMVCP